VPRPGQAPGGVPRCGTGGKAGCGGGGGRKGKN